MIRQLSLRFSSSRRGLASDSSVSSLDSRGGRESRSVGDPPSPRSARWSLGQLPGEGGEVAHAPFSSENASERDQLEDAVRQRDETINQMEKSQMKKHRAIESVQAEIDEERVTQMQESIMHRIEYERLKRQTEGLERRLATLQRDMSDKDSVLEYANLIKSVAPKSGVDSTYVMKLQSQLAKAMKKMDGTSAQMVLVESSCEEVVNSLKSEIVEIVEDRCRTELELRKQVEVLSAQKADLVDEYEEKIARTQRAIDRLEAKRMRKVSSNSDDEHEGDEGSHQEQQGGPHGRRVCIDAASATGTEDSAAEVEQDRLRALQEEFEALKVEKDRSESELRKQLVLKGAEIKELEHQHVEQARAIEEIGGSYASDNMNGSQDPKGAAGEEESKEAVGRFANLQTNGMYSSTEGIPEGDEEELEGVADEDDTKV